ncbi:MAG: hypothetical protein R6X31_11930 [Anaerolineae bacterium]
MSIAAILAGSLGIALALGAHVAIGVAERGARRAYREWVGEAFADAPPDKERIYG